MLDIYNVNWSEIELIIYKSIILGNIYVDWFLRFYEDFGFGFWIEVLEFGSRLGVVVE